jgi:multidrug efflux pump
MDAGKKRRCRSGGSKIGANAKVSNTVQAVIARAAGKFSDAIIFPLNPPAINELGNSTGFDMELQDLAGLGHEKLLVARNQLLEMAAKSPEVVGVRVQGLEDTAQFHLISYRP